MCLELELGGFGFSLGKVLVKNNLGIDFDRGMNLIRLNEFVQFFLNYVKAYIYISGIEYDD